jgi:hypothetical protein
MIDFVQAGIKGGSAPKHRWQFREKEIVRQFYTQDNRSAETALKRFIRTYCHEFNGRQVDLVQVVDILTGLVTL